MLTQFFSHFHEDASQHVLAASIATVASVGVVCCVFDQFRFASCKPHVLEFFMPAKLCQDCIPHDAVFDGLPVPPQLLLAISSKTGSYHRRLGCSDLFPMSRVLELLSLKVVLRCRSAFSSLMKVRAFSSGEPLVKGSDEASLSAILERSTLAIEENGYQLQRIADHFSPPKQATVKSGYVAARLGRSICWIGEMARNGEIPKSCICPRSGYGTCWRFGKDKVDQWIED